MLRSLTRVGMRRGLLGGSRPWTVVFVVAGSLRLLRRIAEGKEVVFSGTLEPGTTLMITNDPAGVPIAAEAVAVGAPPSAAAANWRREGPSAQPTA